jgi:phage terminase small subunit
MANVSNGLTEKMKAFCREYVSNGGNGTQAYLTAYNGNSETAASIESSKLLRRDDITSYIAALNKPMENRIQNEREKKRSILWEFINDVSKSDSDRLKALDLLNKMDSEYININRNITETETEITELDTTKLIRLVETA